MAEWNGMLTGPDEHVEVKHNARQTGMVSGVLNNKEWKAVLKWNAERDEMESGCSGTRKQGVEYGLEESMGQKR